MIDLADESTAIPIAICSEITDSARNELEEEGVRVMDDNDLLEEIRMWDYHKQNQAVQRMVHYYANIEQNPVGTQRLLRFLKEIDPENSAVAQLKEES